MHSHVHIPKISVCNQLLCHLLLQCWIQRACYYEMMCEKLYRMRMWTHSSQGSPKEENFQAAFGLRGAWAAWLGKPEQDWWRWRGRKDESVWSTEAASQHRQSHSGSGSENTLQMGGAGGLGAQLWWKGACGTGGLWQWLCFHSTGRFEGQGDKSQCSLPAMQLPSVLWHGPEGLLLLLTQVPQKLSRKSCYLKWKQSLQPGGMPCGEVSRPWLSQEIMCQFGI